MPDTRRKPQFPTDATRLRLTKHRITAAAIKIADKQGIDAVSMRNVAAALGSGTMSLYRHLASRDELLDAMLDVVYSDLELPDASAGNWRARLRLIAHAQRSMLRSHPWIAPLVGSRPPLLPSFLRSFEASLQALLDGGLDINDAASVSASISALIVGYALLEHADQETLRRTGMTKTQWRARNAPLVTQIMSSGQYPAVATYVANAHDPDPDATFDRALDGLLDNARTRGRGPAGRRPAAAANARSPT